MHTHGLFDVLSHSVMITGFVILVMLIIEYLNVQTSGKWSHELKASPWMQVIIAAILGIIPGCLGTFTAVSMYSHRLINFAALVTVMIASSGDEAFLMMAMIPDKFIIITMVLFGVAVLTGFFLNFIPAVANFQPFGEHRKFHLHSEDDHCVCLEKKDLIDHLKHISVYRFISVLSVLVLLLLVVFGVIGPQKWNWVRYTVLFALGFSLFILVTVPDHFLKAHLWGHVVKKHLLKIFLWTLGTLFVIHLLQDRVDIAEWVGDNLHFVLLLALLVGLIPESGPHMVFLSLFVAGTIPFSVLIVNSIVQDGHGSIPLLAESKKSFLYMKLINIGVAALVGLAGIYGGW